jgi:hypothetical protein
MKKIFFIIIGISLVLNACNSITEYDYTARKTIETSGATSWIFEGKYRPPMKLENDSTFLSSVNLALTKLKLPKISNIAIEKSKLTNSGYDNGSYEWLDYPIGILKIQRSSGSDVNYDNYNCIWKVTIEKR